MIKNPESKAVILDRRFSSAHYPGLTLPWYREPLVWMLIAIPALSVLSGTAMLILALSSRDGLVADDYYRRGMEINLELDRDRAARNRGVSAVLNIDARKNISLTLHQPPEQLPAQLELRLLHATRDGYDRILLLPRDRDGRYRGAVLNLVAGKYYVQVAAGDWRITGMLQYPGKAGIPLEPAVTGS